MSMFDEIAIEAAKLAYRARTFRNASREPGPRDHDEGIEAAFRAAEASLRERGKLRDGGVVERYDGKWLISDRNALEFPVVIIRIGEKP